jgi:hypothetical protein
MTSMATEPNAPAARPDDGDEEAARIADAIARNRRALGLGVVVAFVLASATFFGIGYGFPDAELGFGALAASLGLGAFAGMVVWLIARARTPVFERLSSGPAAPADAETRALEERARRHDARNRLALGVAGLVFLLVGPVALAAWSAHLDALNETRSYFERESIGMGTGSLVLAFALALAGLAWWLLRAKVDVLLELGGSAPDAPARDVAASKEDLAELRRIGDEVRATQRREAVARIGTVAAGVGVAGAVIVAFDRAYAAMGSGAYDDALVVGRFELFVAVGLGAAAALFASRVLGGTPAPAPLVARREDERDWFHDTLSTTGTLTLQAPHDLEAVIARWLGLATNRWSLPDGSGAAFCEASEVEAPLLRRFLPLRGRSIEVRDLDRTPMKLARDAGWGDWRVIADGEKVGTLAPRFFGGLTVRDASGAERMRVRRALLSRNRHHVTRDGAEIARIVRPRRGFFASSLEVPGLSVELPRDATLADRRLLLAAALVLDLDRG